ncbi:circularly permuted type 2 ATP-grasp protein [Aquabacterium sp.]|uniref:circularly permuted type 2 ATP-grasp protein n=1 Tax=Aquabacterium sp. TaxID=1872578 RepID=UPI00248854D6|nr:circularly permuted type 2 ATP-grasp protein [Aquabacterium sp.]MDI1260325.1 circularly permuted type 2 ATP-grasp protein [Aquabacterium sp.]
MPSSLQLFDDDPDQPTAAEALLRRARPVDAGHYDDLRDAEGHLRPGWEAFAEHLGGPLDDLGQRQALLARQIQEDGVTYNIYSAQGGASRPWSLEVLPRLIEPQDWRLIEQGAAQRASLLNQIAADVYGEQKLLKDAYLPAALVLGHPGYLRGLHGVKPLGGVYLHVVAFDMVRAPDGAWWVVSQRTEAPSGLGYVMQNRLIVSRLFPDAFRAMSVQHLASGFRRLLETLQTLAEPCANGQSPRLALLTPGPYNETYFEHAYLARYLGLPLVEGGDLTVRDERLYLKTVQGLEPIHGLLRRLDDDYCDPLELRSDSTLGVPGLMQAVRAGNVVMANALGTGFLESPAVHGFLPALSRHLLGKELMLPSLPTWWCGENAAWQDVKADLGEQVIRPTYPFGSVPFEAVVGPSLDAAALKTWSARIERDRAAHTLQNFVPYAQLPVWSQGQCSMRGASLRVYALADGKGGWQVLPGGMTRIATRDSGPVSMQLGGSSLDTWVITDGAVDTFSMLHQSLRVEDLVQRQRPVASRMGESMFWMGRYTERTEFQLRLVQGLSSVLADDDETDPAVLEALSDLARTNGLVPDGTPSLTKSPRVFERATVEALGDVRAEQGAYSLAYNLGALERSAQALRERLSPEHWRLLRGLGDNFRQRLLGPDGGDQPDLEDPEDDADNLPDLVNVREALDHLAMQLAAVTGSQTDRMTRDAGWRLLTVGRLLERLVSYAGILQAFWQREAMHTPQGFDLLLMLFDSAITFRARFQRRLELPALLAMLVIDETNPRSMACVLRRLRTELGKLPDRAGPKEDLLALLPQEGVGITLEELCEPELGNAALQVLAQRLMQAGWLLSDELGRRYFAHSEPTEQMVSA